MKRAALSSKIAEERQERQSVGRHRRTFEGALIIVGIATISAVMFVLFEILFLPDALLISRW